MKEGVALRLVKIRLNRSSILEKYGLLLVLLAVIVLFSMLSSNFMTVNNILNIGRQVVTIGIAAVGMTFVILTGGIDLSIGSIVGIVGIVDADLMVHVGMNIVLASLIAIAVGGFIGYLNGLMNTKVDIPPIITTLGVMVAVRGLCFIFSNGLPVYGFPDSFSFIGQGDVLGIPFSLLIMIAVFIAGGFVLNGTYFGRYLFAIGGNGEAARLSGIHVKRNLVYVYILSGLLAGIAGVFLLSRINTGQPAMGTGLELDVIAAVVLGGVSISGGEGRLSGVFFGVLLMGVLGNGLILLNVQDYYQQVVKGLVLLCAVGIDRYSKKTRTRANSQ